jgi:hypothetical protein
MGYRVHLLDLPVIGAQWQEALSAVFSAAVALAVAAGIVDVLRNAPQVADLFLNRWTWL